MKTTTNEGGFTALEMLISVSLSAMIFYALFVVMRIGDQQIQQTQVKMFIQDSARIGINKMLEELRQSAPTRIQINNGGTSLQFQIPNPSNPVGNDYKPDWTNSWTISYTIGGLNNAQLIRTNSTTGQTTVLANDVQGITFTGNMASPTVVTINMNVQRALNNGGVMPATPLQMAAQAEIRNI